MVVYNMDESAAERNATDRFSRLSKFVEGGKSSSGKRGKDGVNRVHVYFRALCPLRVFTPPSPRWELSLPERSSCDRHVPHSSMRFSSPRLALAHTKSLLRKSWRIYTHPRSRSLHVSEIFRDISTALLRVSAFSMLLPSLCDNDDGAPREGCTWLTGGFAQ